jgi:cell division protein FtsB
MPVGEEMQRYLPRQRGLFLVVMILALTPRGVHHGWAQNRSADIEALRKQVEQLTAQSRDSEIEVLKRQIEELHRKEAERQRQIEDL